MALSNLVSTGMVGMVGMVGSTGMVGMVGSTGMVGMVGSSERIPSAASGALIVSRDGLVGHPDIPTTPPAHMDFDSSDNFDCWEPQIRVESARTEILSGLKFEADRATQTVSATDAETGDRLFSIKRPSEAQFHQQLDWVVSYADLRRDRSAEILAQTADIVSFVGQPMSLNPMRHHWTFEFLAAAVTSIIAVGQRAKFAMACRRPFEYAPQMQPMIMTPAHSAFPSGHSVEAFAIARILSYLADSAGTALSGGSRRSHQDYVFEHAVRVATNRTVAGVHFPVDSYAGAIIGWSLADQVLRRAGAFDPVPAPPVLVFDATEPNDDAPKTPKELDLSGANFTSNEALALLTAASGKEKKVAQTEESFIWHEANTGKTAVSQNPLLAFYLSKARAEWHPAARDGKAGS